MAAYSTQPFRQRSKNLVFVVLTAATQLILNQDRIEVQTFIFTQPVTDPSQTFRGNSKGFAPNNVIMTTRMGWGGGGELQMVALIWSLRRSATSVCSLHLHGSHLQLLPVSGSFCSANTRWNLSNLCNSHLTLLFLSTQTSSIGTNNHM